jgi:hypothetical protein
LAVELRHRAADVLIVELGKFAAKDGMNVVSMFNMR